MKYIEFDNHLRSSFSFALEEYIMSSDSFDDEYFLFWRTHPTLMIGRFQNTLQEINRKFVEENRIDVVRRNSGGGTIYTDENCWQFSFITWKKSGKMKDFRDFTRPVINALKTLGIDAKFSGRNDLMIGDKKFSGNAQFGMKDRFLHHGAMLFDTNLDNLVKSLNVKDEKFISKGIKSVRERVTNIKPFLNNPNISSLEFKNKMIELLRENIDIKYLSSKDIEKIEKIEKEKFLTWDWNYGNSPEFNVSNSKKLDGGKVETQLNVKNGIITDCSIFGDFFFSGDISTIQNLLIGNKYDKASIKEKLLQITDSDMFYKITTDELLECFFE
ncbi:lipoate--protein ligase [Bacteroidales bacterium OttesenSCG-928-I21]|nr:lipoate--protein ligase [Bacteroidales bacterium OttesenSCG-928-I21]